MAGAQVVVALALVQVGVTLGDVRGGLVALVPIPLMLVTGLVVLVMLLRRAWRRLAWRLLAGLLLASPFVLPFAFIGAAQVWPYD